MPILKVIAIATYCSEVIIRDCLLTSHNNDCLLNCILQLIGVAIKFLLKHKQKAFDTNFFSQVLKYACLYIMWCIDRIDWDICCRPNGDVGIQLITENSCGDSF